MKIAFSNILTNHSVYLYIDMRYDNIDLLNSSYEESRLNDDRNVNGRPINSIINLCWLNMNHLMTSSDIFIISDLSRLGTTSARNWVVMIMLLPHLCFAGSKCIHLGDITSGVLAQINGTSLLWLHRNSERCQGPYHVS